MAATPLAGQNIASRDIGWSNLTSQVAAVVFLCAMRRWRQGEHLCSIDAELYSAYREVAEAKRIMPNPRVQIPICRLRFVPVAIEVLAFFTCSTGLTSLRV